MVDDINYGYYHVDWYVMAFSVATVEIKDWTTDSKDSKKDVFVYVFVIVNIS